MYANHRLKSPLLCLGLIISAPISTFAADANYSPDEPLVIYGSTYRNTATKSALEAPETPQSISIIDNELLDQTGATSIAEALRYAPGVNTELRGGAVNRLDLFTIRGFATEQNFYDGLQLLFNDWNLQPQIDVAAIKQIEVFKGPTSVLYGSMPPGGMVNQIAKSPGDEDINNVQLSLGSHQFKELVLESRGDLNDNLRYSFVGLGRDKNGQAATAKDERWLLAPSIDWQISDRTLVNFNLYYQKDPSMGIYTSLPAMGLFLPNPLGPLSTNAFSGDANWNTYKRDQLLLGYKINHQLNDNWTFLQNTRFMDADALQRNTYLHGLAEDQISINRRAYLTDESSRGITIDNQLSGRIKTGEIEHNLLMGLDYYKLTSDITYQDGIAPTINLYAPDHYQIDRATLALPDYYSDFTLKKEQLGIYLQNQIRFNRLVLVVGGRYDRYKGSEKGTKYATSTATELKQNEFTARIGALYELPSGLSPFVNYAESFEPQNGINRNLEEFEPSKGQQVEAGVKYESLTGATQATAAVYRIVKDNVPTRDPDGSPYDQIQAGEVRSQGVELEVNSQLNDQLDLRFAYTYTDAEITKDNSGLQGKTPVWIPEHNASVWLGYRLTSQSNLGLGVRYIGKAEIDALNTGKVPAATLVDLSYTYQLGKLNQQLSNASLTLTASNLFDKRYYTCYDSNNCWFGAERSLKATLSMEF